ncbi:SIR2-domain-containing protein [Panus rudis PR-1116 ss-1]|nr:SIR2-domain-containing protein [Panus rudis PR-1116 ss-1]
MANLTNNKPGNSMRADANASPGLGGGGGGDPAPPRPKARTNHYHIYALQVAGFLDATELVEADDDTIEDLLEGYAPLVDPDADLDVSGDEEDDPENQIDYVFRDTSATDEENDYALIQEARTTYSSEEATRMLAELKEHGRTWFVNEYVIRRGIPIPQLLYAFGICLCSKLRAKRPKTLRYFLDVAMTRELENRQRLTKYNTVDDAVKLIRDAKRIIILTGAGISVSCGIPDFRSRDGLYATLQRNGEYNLDDPQQMFDIDYFKENPSVFYSFASQIYPANFIPSPCHRFIKLVEDKGKLLRNYTQNIDTLETRAGVKRVLQCHGSFATASCINCKARFPGNAIENDIMNHRIPTCPVCPAQPPPPKNPSKPKKKASKKKNLSVWEVDSDEDDDLPEHPPGVIKPDITFFGEKLSDDFDRALIEDRPMVDLLLVIGTSLKVSPVSDIITNLPHSVPQILINKTPIKHINPDITLLGNADDIILHLCRRLGWDLPQVDNSRSRKRGLEGDEPKRVGDSHVWLFNGAEGGEYVQKLEEEYQARMGTTTTTEDGPNVVTPAYFLFFFCSSLVSSPF